MSGPSNGPVATWFSRACWLALACNSGFAQAEDVGLFSDLRLRVVRIELKESALIALKQDPRNYVDGTAQVGDEVMTEVGVRLRGFGSFRPIDDKPSFMLKFDRLTPGQRYEGHTRLVLNNSVQDTSYLHLFLANRLFSAAGVPAPLVTHAQVELNGRPLGLYVLMETFSQPLLQRWFGDSSGNLYEGQLKDIDKKLEQDSGKGKGQVDLKRLLAATRVRDPQQRLQKLAEILDVDKFLTFVAMEMMIGHWDGYTMNRNNYRIYHDPGSDRLVFLPHGMDIVLIKPDASIWPMRRSILVGAVLQTSEMRQRYRQRFGQLFTNVFQVESISEQLARATQRVHLTSTNPAQSKEFARQASDLLQRVQDRTRHIIEQLAAPEPKPLEFGSAGWALLSSWHSRSEAGQTRAYSADGDEPPSLYVGAATSGGTASWRTRVLLETGRYRFQGRLKARGVQPMPGESRAGAGLRVSGEKGINYITGDTDWRLLEHIFEVPEGGAEVELICELRASGGEVWFESSSLRLVHR